MYGLDLTDGIMIVGIALLVVMMIHYWHRSNVLEEIVKENDQTIINLRVDVSCLEGRNKKLREQCMYYEDLMRQTKVTSCIFEKKVSK